MSRIIIVLPCFNEASRLDVRSFQEFATGLSDIRFLLVNDGSTDGTAGLLDRLHLVAPNSFGVLHLPRNLGKAEAVRRGMQYALEQNAEMVGYWDADLATPLHSVRAFCTLLEERTDIDLVLGSRVKLLGRRIERNVRRHYLGRVFATAASLVLGFSVYDTQCGAKLFRTSDQIRQVFATPFQSRWIFDVEILARLILLRRHLGLVPLEHAAYELPLVEWRDVEGSKVRPWDFLAAAVDLMGIYLRYMRIGALHRPQPARPAAVAAEGGSTAVKPTVPVELVSRYNASSVDNQG